MKRRQMRKLSNKLCRFMKEHRFDDWGLELPDGELVFLETRRIWPTSMVIREFVSRSRIFRQWRHLQNCMDRVPLEELEMLRQTKGRRMEWQWWRKLDIQIRLGARVVKQMQSARLTQMSSEDIFQDFLDRLRPVLGGINMLVSEGEGISFRND